MFLRSVLDLQAKLNASMQRKAANFCRQRILLDSGLKPLKGENADWCSNTDLVLKTLEEEFDISVGRHTPYWTNSVSIHGNLQNLRTGSHPIH